MTYGKIAWGAPPPIRQRSNRKAGKMQRFVQALRARPGMWARYPTPYKGTGGVTALRKRYPGTEWTSRSRGDNAWDVYGRWVGEVSTDPDNPDFVDLP